MTRRNKKDYTQEFLDSLHQTRTCVWCKSPHEPIYRPGFCRHCYKIQADIRKFEEAITSAVHQQKSPRDLKFDLLTAREMKRLALAEGSTYGNLHTKQVDGIQIEYALSQLSKALVKDDLFHGKANLFDWNFTQSQKRLIYYLLSKIIRKHLRRHRRSVAFSRATRSQ